VSDYTVRVDNMPEVPTPITRREYFAAMAMQGLILRYGPIGYQETRTAVEIADTMIRVLSEGQP